MSLTVRGEETADEVTLIWEHSGTGGAVLNRVGVSHGHVTEVVSGEVEFRFTEATLIAPAGASITLPTGEPYDVVPTGFPAEVRCHYLKSVSGAVESIAHLRSVSAQSWPGFDESVVISSGATVVTLPTAAGFSKASVPASQSATSNGILTLPVPSGVQDGELLLAWVRVSGPTPPAGWTVAASASSTSALWQRTALSEPPSYTWLGSAGTSSSGCMVAVRGLLGSISVNTDAGPMVFGNVTAGAHPGALWLGFAYCRDPGNDEDFTVSGSHSLQIQHSAKGPAQTAAATGISMQTGLAVGQTVSGNAFIDTGGAISSATAAVIINPATVAVISA